MDSSESIRRPSPASVLFLENGGGKSVLIKLIFSVMLPNKRDIVGTKNTNVLEKFVLRDDVSHVVLEWMHSETGERLITGKISAWRGHVLAADSANLLESWYCFRPSEALNLDSLPLVDEDRLADKKSRVTKTAFQERLREAVAGHHHLEFSWTSTHKEWTERLDSFGLDTELFRYQGKMNAGEGEAAEAFALDDDEGFIKFLLGTVLSTEEPRELASALATYSENLAQRSNLVLERDFVAGALELLAPLAREESVASASRKLAEQARATVVSFAGEVAARDQRNRGELDAVRERTSAALEAEKMAESDQRRRGAVVAELRRLVARLQLTEASQEQESATSALEEARMRLQAWQATGVVLEHLEAADSATQLRRIVGGKEEKARPALEAKNNAAVALARGLLGLAAQAGREAREEQELVQQKTLRAGQAQHDHGAATSAAATARAKAVVASGHISQVREQLEAAVREGLLSEAAAVTEAVVLAKGASAAAIAETEKCEADIERLGDEERQAQSSFHEAQQRVESLKENHRRAEEELVKAREKADSLASEPRLIGLLDVDAIDLETDSSTLLDLLADAKGEAERNQIELEIADASDKQALLALDNGDLLPGSPEVVEACEILEAAGITAMPGWDYLARIPGASGRQEIAARVPQLISGVLLNDSAQVERAAQVLTESPLCPITLVAVGTKKATESRDVALGAHFAVALNPALYDPDAAQLEQSAIRQRHVERRNLLEVLADQLKHDDDLAHRVTAWRTEYPVGALAELADKTVALIRELDVAISTVDQCASAVGQITARRKSLRDQLPGFRSAARESEDRERRLSRLAELSAQIPQWTDEARAAEEAAEIARTRAKEAETKAVRLRAESAEHQRTADAQQRTADSAKAELSQVPGGGSVSEDDAAPSDPVEVLRGSFRAASEAYAKVEVGGDLQAQLRQTELAESKARATIEELDERIHALAKEFLETPAGSEASARSAAKEQASRKVSVAEERQREAISAEATCKAALTQLPQPTGPLDAFEQPRDIDHGRVLIEEANSALAEATREWEIRVRAHEESRRVEEQVSLDVSGFGALVDGMLIELPDDEVFPVYEGDLAGARDRYSALNEVWNSANGSASIAEERVRAAADELAQYAADKKFEKLGVPVRRQIVSVRRTELPSHAGEWAEALRPRLRTLTGDLDQIERHRGGLITRLQGMVDGALRVLRSAQRVSRLPEGLGQWSGQEFLRIVFTQLEDVVLAERLGDVIDETAVGRTKDGREVKKDGMSLLLRGVIAAAPKGFRVDVLKPDSVLRTERQRVSEIRDVFSGGQQLTAAIILYCTMAALRANNRGRVKNRHSGVLFLDNPIGRASAGYLLELQRAVAEALGVQLIYTTGLFDAGALSEFPLIVRLRNDADLRAGRKYLSVDETITAKLPDENGSPEITATRMFVREGERSAVVSTGK